MLFRSFFNINEFNQNYTTLFPNPASSFLNIKIVETSKIELFDIIGNKIYEEMGNDIQMNLENYKDGYYVVRISRKKIVENYKLIISK